jgi:hypothetical protein
VNRAPGLPVLVRDLPLAVRLAGVDGILALEAQVVGDAAVWIDTLESKGIDHNGS